MNNKVLIGIALAAVVVAIAAAALLMNKPPSEGATATAPSSVEKAYLYSVRLQGGQAVQMSAVYIPLKDGAVYGQLTPQGSTYFMVKDNGVINILAQGQGTYQKYTYFSRLMEICTNSTVTTTVAGEQLTVTNSQCTPSAAPLPTAKRVRRAGSATSRPPRPHLAVALAEVRHGPDTLWTGHGIHQHHRGPHYAGAKRRA
jgi:hypothetical protein